MTERLQRLARSPASRSLVPLVVVLLIGAVFHQEGAFFRWDTHRAMLREISVHGILACGMTVVIITAGIDLAVGSVLALSAVTLATLLMPLGWSALPAVLVVLALGSATGRRRRRPRRFEAPREARSARPGRPRARRPPRSGSPRAGEPR